MIDAVGTEVAGLGGALTVEISKVGGAFVAGAGAQAETSDGWYEYTLTAGETDTVGPLAIKITGAGAIQQNLYFFVKSAAAGAYEFTYTVTDSVTLLPIEGVHIWVSTDIAGNNVVWSGTTDAFGVARALDSTLPWLDAGTYYFWSQRVGYTFINPDAETVSAVDVTGETTGTPIAGGVATGVTQYNPLPYTLLSIDRYAKVMGINPMHFRRGATPALTPQIMPLSTCSDIWYKYDWQDNDRVSWMQIAQEIANAEQELANYIGYWPAPVWIEEEEARYPRPYLREAVGSSLDARNFYKAIESQFGRFISGGVRAVTSVGTATTVGGSLAYTDEDADGFFETATITLPTTLTNIQELKIYISGQEGAKEWEIRPVRDKYLSGGNVVFIVDSWLLIEPVLYEEFTDEDGIAPIDISTPANFVIEVEVYREYTDTTATSAQFYWESAVPSVAFIPYCSQCGGSGCTTCGYTVQNGCLSARSPKLGMLIPAPGTYDADNAVWERTTWAECREPDLVKMWYKAGELDQQYIKGVTHDPLSEPWARIIAFLATARLERPLCGCSNAERLSTYLQQDITMSTREATFFTPDALLKNPFGTRRGEMIAWRHVGKTVDKRLNVAII
jgi:hypothetical protein